MGLTDFAKLLRLTANFESKDRTLSPRVQAHSGVSTRAVAIEKAKSTSRVRARTFSTARLIDSLGDLGVFMQVRSVSIAFSQTRSKRGISLIAILIAGALTLTACIQPPVLMDSSANMSWQGSTLLYPQSDGTGDYIAICESSVATCLSTVPGDTLYAYLPPTDATSVQFRVGLEVVPFGGGSAVPLPSGNYVAQAIRYLVGTPGSIGATLPFSVPPVEAPDPPPVQQSVGLPLSGSCEDVDAGLLEWAGNIPGGWGKSWQQWVRDGTGGDVCTRMITFIRSSGTWAARLGVFGP